MAALKDGPIYDVTVEPGVLAVDGNDVPIIHARPDGMPRAGVVLHPDVMGLRPLFDDMSRRLASYGFGVCTVEPFAHVDESQRGDVQARMAAATHLDDDVQLADLDAAANLLVVEDDVTRVSVLGFCMGGYYTFKAAASGRFDAAVAFYGMLRTPEGWRGPGHRVDPLEVAEEMCPTLAIFGSSDTYTPAADIDALRDAWKDRDDCEIIVVEGAEHGFVHDPERPVHRPEDATALWQRAIDWMSA
jgi:carboxymethylenebutenolidase